MHAVHGIAHTFDRHAGWLLAAFSSASLAFGLGWSLLALVRPFD